jgi:hypothetical protein
MSFEKYLELRNRTKRFALRVLHISQALPRTREANILSNQKNHEPESLHGHANDGEAISV